MFAIFALLIGLIGRFFANVDAGDGTLKALLDDSPVSKHLSSGFRHGAMDEEMHEKGFLEKVKSHEGVHAIDSDGLALEEKELILKNPEFLGKILKMALGEKEEHAEGDLKAAVIHIIKLLESTVGGAFLKQEEFSKLLKDQQAEKPEVLYTSGEHLHDKIADKDVKPYWKDEDMRLFKAITELKASESMVPTFGKPVSEDFLKTLFHGEKALEDGKHLDVLKSLEGLKAESLLNKDKLLAVKSVEAKDIPHPIVLGKEHLLKDEIAKSNHPEKAFASEEEFKNHKTFHEEKATHHKDFVFDELLKHEEAHAYGDDLGTKESSEFDEELYPNSFLRELHKTKADLDIKKDVSLEEKGLKIYEAKDKGIKQLDKASLDTSLAKKDLSSEGILNKETAEKGKKIGEAKDIDIKQGGTHAYEKAKDQAHKDATIPFSEEGNDGLLLDEALKAILSGTKVEAGKILPETKIYTEEALKKEKALIDSKKLLKKLFEEHDIAKGINHGIKTDEAISKGIHHDIKLDEGMSKGIHHGIKTDEDISKGIHHGIKLDDGMSKGIHHGIKTDEDISKGIHHGIKLDEGISKGIHHRIKTDEDISKGIHHGIKFDEGISKGIIHGIKTDEDISKGIGHGIKLDEGISKGVHHGIKLDEGISKGIHHGKKFDEDISKGIHHGIKMDEEIAKGIKEHFTRDKHVHLSTPGEVHKTLSRDSIHSKAQFLKKKVLEILSHVLQMKKCHLVNMKPGELLSIVNCISNSKDPILCEKFSMCEKKMPPQVILALELCQKELLPEEALKCSKYEPLYPSPNIPIKIFQCIVKNTRELLPEEKKQMIAFEECARLVKAESCGRIPWG